VSQVVEVQAVELGLDDRVPRGDVDAPRCRAIGPFLRAGSASLHHGAGADRRPAPAPRRATLLPTSETGDPDGRPVAARVDVADRDLFATASVSSAGLRMIDPARDSPARSAPEPRKLLIFLECSSGISFA
jgi:hypothetical protein